MRAMLLEGFSFFSVEFMLMSTNYMLCYNYKLTIHEKKHDGRDHLFDTETNLRTCGNGYGLICKHVRFQVLKLTTAKQLCDIKFTNSQDTCAQLQVSVTKYSRLPT